MSEVRTKHSHYHKPVHHLQYVDVYRVLALFNVTDPCLQHAIKKLLVAGGRGAGKDIAKDVQEAADSLVRWQEMRNEDLVAAAGGAPLVPTCMGCPQPCRRTDSCPLRVPSGPQAAPPAPSRG